MSADDTAAQLKAQAQRREAIRVTGEVGVLHSSVDLWESKTHGKPREGTCVDAMKRSDGVVMARKPDSNTEYLQELQLLLLP